MARQKDTSAVKHTSKKTGLLVYEFSKDKGSYYVYPDCGFYKFCKKISFIGFNKLPKGFYSDGYGFGKPAGTYLTNILQERFGNDVKLIVTSKRKSEINKGDESKIILNHQDYLRILEPLKLLGKERNIKSNQHVTSILCELFPKHYKKTQKIETIFTYEDDKISKILGSDDKIFEKLSKKDVESITEIYDKIAKEGSVKFSSIALAERNKRKNERVYLESVVNEFEKRLQNPSLSESDWQRFLQKYILLFNTSYIQTVEKQSVDLRGKYPDFMLINVYGYTDIFEIKKPNTNLLKHDSSRDNYYWDTEVNRAIIQTEKYIQMMVKKEKDVIEIINDKYDLNVKIVRPRGFIVVGNSQQFEGNKKTEDDFRLLASSLKNVDIILYDELLNNLKNLIVRLKK